MASPAAVAPDRLPANFDFSKPITIPDRLPADFDFSTPPHEAHAAASPDHAVRDHLKNQGFLDSAWDAVKGPFAAMGSLFNGEYRRQHEADYARMEELQKNGTPEQRREFGKEMLLKHIPLASTVYKAAQGNIGGTVGDVVGMIPLAVAGGAATPEVAGTARRAGGAFVDSMAESPVSKPGAAVGAATGGTLGYRLAGAPGGAAGGAAGAAIGAKLPAIPGAIADAIESARAGWQMETNPPRPAPAWTTITPDVEPVPPEPIYTVRPPSALPSGRVPGHLRQPQVAPVPPPEVAPAAAPEPLTGKVPVAEATAPAPRTLAQTEAAMAQKAPPPFDPAAARSPVHETGETKSPQFRAEEIKRGNAEAKAQRIAQALHDFEVPPESISKIPMERYTPEQIAQGATPGWPNIIDELVKHGKLPAGEKPPTQSLPFIQKYMRKLAADRLAQRLADEMKRSGTVQDVMGVNGKTTVGEMMQQ